MDRKADIWGHRKISPISHFSAGSGNSALCTESGSSEQELKWTYLSISFDPLSYSFTFRMERDAAFTQKKAERACLRVHLREKYRLPKVRHSFTQ